MTGAMVIILNSEQKRAEEKRQAKDSRPLATVRSFPAAFPKLELFGFYL